MSFEVFEKLEAKVQQAIDTITLLHMELEEVKEKKETLEKEAQSFSEQKINLLQENQRLKEEQTQWQERLRVLLTKMEEV